MTAPSGISAVDGTDEPDTTPGRDASAHLNPADTDTGVTLRAANKTTSRVLRVLSAFLENSGAGYRINELSRKLGIPKQTTIRALQTLAREGYVVARPNGAGYDLGYRIFELGNLDKVEQDLLAIATPTMQRMSVLTGETISLSTRVGDHTVYMDSIDGHWPLTGQLRKGQMTMLHVGPVSRTVLAYLSDFEIQDFIARHSPLPAFTENAITSPEQLWVEIREIRERGYGEGVVLPGVYTIGFPIFGSDNRPHGSIAIVGLTGHITGPRVRSSLGEIIELIDELNEQTRLFHAEQGIDIAL